jgi:hypothetical protein
MGLDNFFKGANMFAAGVQQFQRSRALRDANKAVAELRSQQLDEFDKNMKLGEIVQDLSFNMMAQGSSPQEAIGLSQILMPQASTQFYQSVDQALINARPDSREYQKAREVFETRMDFQREKEEAGREERQQRAGAIQGRFDRRELTTSIKDFNAEPGVKTLKENLTQVETLSPIVGAVAERLKGGKKLNDIDISESERASIELTRLAIARLVSNQRVSNQIFDATDFSQSKLNQLSRFMKNLFVENPTEQEVRVGAQLLKQFEDATKRTLESAATRHTQRSMPIIRNQGLSPKEYRETIMGREGLGAEGLDFPDQERIKEEQREQQKKQKQEMRSIFMKGLAD